MSLPMDAITAARFSIVIDGYEIAAFSDLQGIVTKASLADALALALRRSGLTVTRTA